MATKKTTSKKSFVIYDNWTTILAGASDEITAQLIKAICNWKLGREYEIKDPTAQAIFESMLPKLEEDAESYQHTCEKNKRIAEEREEDKHKRAKENMEGDKTEHERSTNVARTCNERSTVEHLTDTDTDNDNDIINPPLSPLADLGTADASPTKAQGVDWDRIASMFVSRNFGEKFCNWLAVRMAKGKYPYESVTAAINGAKKAELKHGADKCTPLAEKATEGAWSRIPWEDLEKRPAQARSGTTTGGKPKFTDFQQHDYDFAALEKALVQ